MPSLQPGWNSSSRSSFGIRAGAGLAVVALHAAVIGAIFLAPESRPELEEPEAIMVSVVDAPVPQIAKAEPIPEVQQPVVETPPEPEPEQNPEDFDAWVSEADSGAAAADAEAAPDDQSPPEPAAE